MAAKETEGGSLRVAVIGAGYLGRFHAQKYKALPGVELAGVIDRDPRRAAEVGAELGVPFGTDPAALPGGVRAVSVAVPTREHCAVALPLLERGVHVLVEKPIAEDPQQARAMIRAAAAAGAVLQVGHLERFNPAVQDLLAMAAVPLYIEAHRLGNFTGRATDVDVVLDLMIHDLDILLTLVGRPVREIRAHGVPILTGKVDLANARISFVGGCTANLTASRVSLKAMRKFRVFHRGGYVAADCAARRTQICRAVRGEGPRTGRPALVGPIGQAGHISQAGAVGQAGPIAAEVREHPPGDALLAEITAFLGAVRGENPVAVTGQEGLAALELAREIGAAIAANLAEIDLGKAAHEGG